MIKKKGQKSLVLSFLGVIATALVLSIGFGSSAALADTGVGSGVGGGGSASGSRWVAGWGAKGEAWNALRNNSNLYRSGAYDGSLESLMRNNVRPPSGYNIDQFINLCKDSSVIWWIQDSASNYRFWGKSYATNMSTDNIMSGTNGLNGYDREKNDARNALNAYGSDSARRDITIVCSAVYTPPETYKSRVWNASQGVSATYTADLSHTYTETPDYVPANNLSNQSRTVNTVFKGAFDSANVNSVDSFNSANANLSGAANSADQKPSRDNFLPVGDPNRDGLIKQGALSLTTTTNSATITIGYTRNQNLVQYATCDVNGNNCNWNGQPGPNAGYSVTGVSGESWASSRPADSGWYQVGDNGWTTTKSAQSTRDNGFFQILSSKCNVNWFLAARNAAPGNAPLNTGISNYSLPDNNVLNTGHNNYISRPKVTGDNTVLMGVPGDSTSITGTNGVEKTAYSFFYSRPCSEGRWANEQVNVNGTAEWNQPYSYSSDIVRQAITGGPANVTDPIGADNLRDQKGVEGNGYSRTSYGYLRDRMAAGNGADTNIYGSVDKAVAADQNFPTPSITLNQGNQEGMAEGGVLNVFERTRWADISSFQNDLYYRAMAQTAIYNWDSATGNWKLGTWINNVKDDGSNNLNSTQLAEVNGSNGARGWKNSLSDQGIAPPGPSASYPCGTTVGNAPGACPASGVNYPDIVVTVPDNSNETVIKGIYTNAAPAASLGWYKKATTYSNKQNLDTPQDTGFWQMMSVHCNVDEVQPALDAYGVADQDYFLMRQATSDTGVTTMVNTKRYPSMPTTNGSKLFGFSSSPVTDPRLLRTGNLGFYDKECSLQCVTDSATGNGSTATNGAVSNVSNNGTLPQLDELGGAISDGTISNYFEMFRDNKDRTITTNIAYPNVSGTAFKYDGHAPVSTTATLWKDPNTDPATRLTVPEGDNSYPVSGGTPDTSPSGGQLNVTAIGGTGSGAAKDAKDLFTGTQAPSTQKNFTGVDATHPVDTFSGPYSTQVAGAYNKFNVSATWASLKDRPVVMNVKWEYQPTTNTAVAKTVGFQLNGREKIDEVSFIDQKIDVRCYANYGSSNSFTPDGEMAASKQTGTGTTNVIDRNVLNAAELGNGGADTTAYKNGSNLVIKFVRGVAE